MKNQNIAFILLFLLIFIVFRGLGLLVLGFDWTLAQLMICIITVAGVTMAWSWLQKSPPFQSFREVGFGIPGWRAVGISVSVSLLLLAFFPLYSKLTHIELPLQINWLWILIGIVAGTGIAEETLFRGYAFNYYRQTHGFWRAATLSMILFGAMHFLLLFWLPIPIAVAAILLSVIAAYPTAYLFENGKHTIWPPAIFHSTALATNLFIIPPELTITVSLLWIVVLVIGMVLIFVAGRLFLGGTKSEKIPAESKAL